MGDKIAQLQRAATAIDSLPGTVITARSRIYRTPPWGMTEQDWFANAALRVETTLSPHALLDACLAIEAQMGRIRTQRWGPRVIDLDVLMHGEAVIHSDTLTLPHPAISERAFVLMPLQDIAPNVQIKGKTPGEWITMHDTTGIEPIADFTA